MKNAVSILVLFFGLTTLWGQNERETDSLKKLLQTADEVATSVALQEKLFEAYIYTFPDSANHYRKSIRKISTENKYTVGQYLYFSLSGRYHFAKSDIDSAFYCISKAAKIAESLDNKAYLADCYKKIGVIYNINRNDSLTKKYAEMALDNALQTDDWRLTSSIYVLLGNRGFQRADYPEALTYYLKLDSIYSAQNSFDRSLAAAYTNIGMIYSELKNPEAVDYIQKSIEVYQALGLTEGVYHGEVALGTYYDLMENNEKAITHLHKAEGFYEEYGNLRILASIFRRLGACYLDVGEYSQAEAYLKKAASLPENVQEVSAVAANATNLGDLYLQIGELDQAISSFEKSLELLRENVNEKNTRLYLLNAYQGLYEAYKGKGAFGPALRMLEKKTELQDSIQKSQNESVVEELNKKYQNEKQQQEIALLTSQSELAAQKSKNQRNVMTAGLSVLGLASIALFILFRNKQKTNRKLKQLETAKSRFFANISHEFRTPLTLISGPVSHQLSKGGLSPEDQTDLTLIQRNADRLLNLVDQILDLSKIEAGRRKLNVTLGDIGLFLKHLAEPFRYQAGQKEMYFESSITISDPVWFDRDVVEKVVANLLSNALKYNKKHGKIEFYASMQAPNTVVLQIQNENSSLKEEELPLLFDRFYQSKATDQGFGIGLSLVRELVHLSGGKITANKPSSETVAFTVSLPCAKKDFAREDFAPREESPVDSEVQQEQPVVAAGPGEGIDFQEDGLPVLLVVDDNEDIRLFIQSLFQNDYQIIQAGNGEEGVALAVETIPDLIVSDIMMPVRDGIYLSNTLKSDERTSHIPIVLLTAKSGEENELEGLKTGADAYMVKPFKEEKLRVTIDSLIATRAAIQEKFSKQVFLKPKGVELTRVDTLLMHRIQQILDKELTNPDFNVSSFSQEVGLSRMHLHRKLKALTGLSTSEFIRTQRLKLAAQLLKAGHDNISEIGYSVGFNQPAYFSTAFKEHFGCSPSEFGTS